MMLGENGRLKRTTLLGLVSCSCIVLGSYGFIAPLPTVSHAVKARYHPLSSSSSSSSSEVNPEIDVSLDNFIRLWGEERDYVQREKQALIVERIKLKRAKIDFAAEKKAWEENEKRTNNNVRGSPVEPSAGNVTSETSPTTSGSKEAHPASASDAESPKREPKPYRFRRSLLVEGVDKMPRPAESPKREPKSHRFRFRSFLAVVLKMLRPAESPERELFYRFRLSSLLKVVYKRLRPAMTSTTVTPKTTSATATSILIELVSKRLSRLRRIISWWV